MIAILALALTALSFDVKIEHWDGKTYATTLDPGDAVLAWPGRTVTVTPRLNPIEPRARVTPLFAARPRGRGRGFSVTVRPGIRTLEFRVVDLRKHTHYDTGLSVLVPVRLDVDSDGVIRRPEPLNGYRLGLYPSGVPEFYRDRAKVFADSLYVVSDSSMKVSPNFSLSQFISKLRPERLYMGRSHPLALDYGLVDALEKIFAAWKAAGYRGRMRIESPFRTPDYNNAAEAGRAEFSQHMYGSAADVILSEDDDHLQDDIDGDGDRDLDDILPLARIAERLMIAGKIPRGGLGVYHYIYHDGRPEEFTMHVDIRGKLVKWGSVYDSDIVRPSAAIKW